MSDGGETVGMRGDAHEQLTEQLLPPAEPSTDRRATSAGIGARSASIGSIGSIASVRSTASRNRLQTLANPFMARVEVGDALEEEEEHRPFAWLDRDRADSVQSGTSLSEVRVHLPLPASPSLLHHAPSIGGVRLIHPLLPLSLCSPRLPLVSAVDCCDGFVLWTCLLGVLCSTVHARSCLGGA